MIDYSSAASKFERELDFLLSLSFQDPIARTESSKLIGDSLLMTFFSEQSGISLEISYVVAQKSRPSAITAFVIANEEDRFSVEDWLTAKGMQGTIQFSTISDPNLSEDAFIDRFCRTFKVIVHNQLKDVLVGKTWENVPIDWKGYR